MKQIDNSLFYRWVPRPIGIMILMLMFVPPTFSGGAYLCNISEMSGGMGVLAEDVQLAAFFTSIGMCLFPPFMVRFLQVRKIKQTFLWCFLLLAVLNLLCAVTSSFPLLLGVCLLTGFVRVIVMLNCTFTIAPYLTGMNTLDMFTMTEEPPADVQYALERKRTFLMPVLYFYILIISQASNMVTAWFACHYNWQDSYYAVVGMQFVALLLVMVTMHDEDKRMCYRPQWEMLPDMLLMATALCSMVFVLVYGKTLGWFDSSKICIVAGICVISAGLFLCRAVKHRDIYYLPLKIFSFRNVWMATLLFLITMIFNSANVFVGTYAKLSTPIDNLHGAFLSRWAIAGCVAGLLLSLVMVKMKLRFRTIFATGFILMAFANACLYFQYQTTGLFSNMILPTILNFTGLLVLYSLVAAFGMKSLPSRYLAAFVFLMIWMRNAIAPVVGTSVYANWLQNRQQYHVERLAQDIIPENSMAASVYSVTESKARYSGKGSLESAQSASTVLKSRVTLQAVIVAMKEITGQTVVLLLVTVVVVCLLPYHRGETS